MNRRQGTLAGPVVFEGRGIHTGNPSRVVVGPAPCGHGRVFRSQGVDIPARVTSVVRSERATTLGANGVEVATVEHLLAAAAGLRLDNLLIEVEGGEVPILDGSGLGFCQGLWNAGRVEQEAQALSKVLRRPVWVSQDDTMALALPHDREVLEYHLYYDHPQLGHQTVSFEPGRDSFEAELAPARTFGLWEEVQVLLDRGLARGGDFDNALVVYRDRFSSPLRLESEPVRHKCLDLLGDLALLEHDLVGRVVIVRGGHRLHLALASSLLQEDLYVERTPDQRAHTAPVSYAAPRRGDPPGG